MSIETIYFDVTVSGAFIDPLKFYEYDDYTPSAPSPKPADKATSVTKAIAFTRFKEIQNIMAQAATPFYYNLSDSGTGGDAGTVPTAVNLIVGYTSADALYEYFDNSKDLNPAPLTPEQKLTVIEDGLTALVQNLLDTGIGIDPEDPTPATPTIQTNGIGMEILDFPTRLSPPVGPGTGDEGQVDMEFIAVPTVTATASVTQRATALPNPL
ncbi:hypothetical protein NVP2275O_042 [Vibrio phage 2.275.O._10N.286.54.E11]|nr:hypothetical protein NVP2275O_042 [Vibrio phage 2.275.O._10N.286.54.E11]